MASRRNDYTVVTNTAKLLHSLKLRLLETKGGYK